VDLHSAPFTLPPDRIKAWNSVSGYKKSKHRKSHKIIMQEVFFDQCSIVRFHKREGGGEQNWKSRDYFEDIGRDGRIILNWISK
jgi:hypothetical protein